MPSVWYIGTATIRLINEESWVDLGLTGEDVAWTPYNGWSISQSEFTPGQLTWIDNNDEFAVVPQDGPRPNSIIQAVPPPFITEARFAELLQNVPVLDVLATPNTGVRRDEFGRAALEGIFGMEEGTQPDHAVNRAQVYRDFMPKAGGNFAGNVLVPALQSLSVEEAPNVVFEPNGQEVAAAPAGGGLLWHDLFRMNRRWGSPVAERKSGAGAWTAWDSRDADRELFSGKQSQGITVISAGQDQVRWTWSNTQWSMGRWLVIGFGYADPAPNRRVMVESSSDGGNSWTTRHDSASVNVAAPIWFKVGGYLGHDKLRVTISRLDPAGDVRLSGMQLLTARWGDQGGGQEESFPYRWNGSGQLGIGGEPEGGASLTTYQWINAKAGASSGVDPVNAVDLTRKSWVEGLVNPLSTAIATKADTAAVNAALAGKANTGHTHGVADLTASGTRDGTTFLRSDNTWAAPPNSGGGVTSHAALTGLAADDHTQYYNQTRGDARYLQSSAAPELIRDTIGATLVEGNNVDIAVDDVANTITIHSSGGSLGGGDYLRASDHGWAPGNTAAQNDTAIAAAIAACRANGVRRLYLGIGTYNISVPIDLRALTTDPVGIEMFGSTRHTTIINQTTATADVLQVGGYVNYVRDLCLRHSEAAFSAAIAGDPTTLGAGLSMFKMSYGTVERVQITANGRGIKLAEANVFEPGTTTGTGNYFHSVSFTDVFILRYSVCGLEIDNPGDTSTGSNFHGVWIQNNSTTGTRVAASRGAIRLRNCDEMFFAQTNIEDGLGNMPVLLNACGSIVFDSLHFERMDLNGAEAQYIRTAGNSIAVINGMTVAFSDIAVMGSTGTRRLLSTVSGGKLHVVGLTYKNITNTAALPVYVVTIDDTGQGSTADIRAINGLSSMTAYASAATISNSGLFRLGDVHQPVTLPSVLSRFQSGTITGTISVDAGLANVNNVDVTAQGTVTVPAPTNPSRGQIIQYTILASGADRTVNIDVAINRLSGVAASYLVPSGKVLRLALRYTTLGTTARWLAESAGVEQ